MKTRHLRFRTSQLNRYSDITQSGLISRGEVPTTTTRPAQCQPWSGSMQVRQASQAAMDSRTVRDAE
jgi:multidrug resistance efflux pump